MNDFDLGWVCGIIEGEGCFTYCPYQHRRIRNDKKRMFSDVLILIRVSQVDRKIVDKLCRLTKVGTVKSKKVYDANLSKKPQFEWRVSRRGELRRILPIIKPYLSKRRQSKIKEMLRFLAL